MLFPRGALVRAFWGKGTLPDVDASTLACVGVAGYLLALAFPVSSALDLPLVFLVVVSLAAAFVGLPQAPAGPRSLILLPLLAFAGARLVSALAAPEAIRSLQIVAPLLPALLVFFAVSEWVRTPRHVVAIYASLTAAGLVLSATFLATAWVGRTGAPDAWAQLAPSPLLVVNNDLTVVAVLAPLAVAAALARPHPAVRLLVAAFCVALVAVIAVAQSRTALVTAVVSLGSFAVLAPRRLFAGWARVWLVVAGTVALVVAVDAVLGFRLGHKVLGEWQGNGRLSLWAAALAMFRDAPVLGQGPYGFMLHHRAYLDGLSLPAWVHVEDRVTPWAHNLYLELLAEQGALGLAAFGATVAAAAVTFARIRRTPRSDIQLLAAGAGAALAAFLTAAWTELSFIRAWVTIVLFTLLGLLATLTRVERESRI